MADARGRLDGLIYAEIARRRRTGERGDDVLSLLLDAPTGLGDRHVRDHVMTLLFAGHDTTTATIAFLFYELARHPEIAGGDRAATTRCSTRRSRRRCGSTRRPGSARAARPRRSSSAATAIAAGAPVNYSSWASHRLPDVWEAPHEFRPERFSPEQRGAHPQGRLRPVRRRLADLPRDALRPARDQGDRGRASRERFRVELPAGFRLRIRQTPTLGPAGGLPVRVRVAREPRED